MPSATIGAELNYKDFDHNWRHRMIRLDITGLAAGPNTIPHGILTQQQSAVTIQREDALPTSAVVIHQTQPGDSTNLYYTVDSGAGTTISVWVTV